MDTQMHLLDLPARPEPGESTPIDRPRSGSGRPGPARHRTARPRPAGSGPWVLADEVRATGLRGVAEARAALAVARHRTEEEPSTEPRPSDVSATDEASAGDVTVAVPSGPPSRLPSSRGPALPAARRRGADLADRGHSSAA